MNYWEKRGIIAELGQTYGLDKNVVEIAELIYSRCSRKEAGSMENKEELLIPISLLLASKLTPDYLQVGDLVQHWEEEAKFHMEEERIFIFLSCFVGPCVPTDAGEIIQSPLITEKLEYGTHTFERGNFVCKIYKAKERVSHLAVLEFHVLHKIKNSNCPNLLTEWRIGYDTHQSAFYFIAAKADYVLHSAIYDDRLSDELIGDLSEQIIKGMKTLHSLGVTHCDINPKNILLYGKEKFRAVLADYDCCSLFSPRMGTPTYSAPEFYSGTYSLTNKVDYWSMGCTIYEMCNKTTLCYEFNQIDFRNINVECLENVLNGKKFYSLLKDLLKINPEERNEYRNTK